MKTLCNRVTFKITLLALVSLALASVRVMAGESKMVGKASCATCHTDIAEGFAKTFHGRKMLSDPKLANACEACHGAGGAHADSGGDASKIINPKKLDSAAAAEFCLNCHKNKQLMLWKTGAHSTNNVSCLKCHSVHNGVGRQSLISTTKNAKYDENVVKTDVCTTCHIKQRNDMRLPSHHPVPEGKMSCVSCHNPHGGIEGNLKADSAQELCAKCHSEKVGPFAYDHPPVSDGCSNCHVVHGSSAQRLLKQEQPYLCLSCHKFPHQVRSGPVTNVALSLKHIEQRRRCTDCHRDIHGSDSKAAFKD